MNSTSQTRGHLSVTLKLAAAALLAATGPQAMALGVTLCAEPFTQALPGGSVPMWGYRQVATTGNPVADCASGGTATAPGPVITVPANDTSLAITLVNRLNVPTSIVIAAQALPVDGGAPVMAPDVVGPECTPNPALAITDPAHPQNCRVRSFTGETAAGAARTYTFNNLRPGTYLYQSGTHPQVQVQMGLFGLAKQDAPLLSGSTVRQLHTGANAGFDVDVPVVLSEIDPEQHFRIAMMLGGVDPTLWKLTNSTTLNYTPRFFLINGKVFDAASPNANELVAANAGNGARVVLRVANAGLMSRSLMLNTGTWKLLTEDGYPYPAAREQATALVPAGKTTDALLISTAPADGSTGRSVAIFDRRGGTDNSDGNALGGQIARLAQSGPAVPFIAPIGNQIANEGSTFTLQVNASNIKSYALGTFPAGATVSATGLISWAVPLGTAVPTNQPFTVVGSDGVNPPVSQSFAVRVNHTPTIAQTGPIAVAHGAVTVPAAGVLAGATDPDGDALTAVQTGAVSSGTLTLSPATGAYTWTGPQPATGSRAVTFAVAARDGLGLTSTPKTVTLNVAANVAPVANADAYTITLARVALPAPFNVALAVNTQTQVTALTSLTSALTNNDNDPDGGSINVGTVTLVANSVRRINPGSPANCTTNCATIAPAFNQQAASVTFNSGTGTFILVPMRGAVTQIPVAGTYEFRYTVRDDQNALSNQATVRVTVN